MFGSVSQWMIQWLGGIQPDPNSVGFDKLVIQPQTPKGLDWVKSSQVTIRGKIVSNWSRQGSKVTYNISIPVNTSAKVILPANSIEVVPHQQRPLIRTLNSRGMAEFSVGSGTYAFSLVERLIER